MVLGAVDAAGPVGQQTVAEDPVVDVLCVLLGDRRLAPVELGLNFMS